VRDAALGRVEIAWAAAACHGGGRMAPGQVNLELGGVLDGGVADEIDLVLRGQVLVVD
jgi:hypothetical protein